eukprot:GHVT01103504.1.p1 GENE.GHVT01103504.1~~GHVT01103504.1.p1  ORF type:complete len:114 (+),score=17.38 GHVT01103504.1:214-555(+)
MHRPARRQRLTAKFPRGYAAKTPRRYWPAATAAATAEALGRRGICRQRAGWRRRWTVGSSTAWRPPAAPRIYPQTHAENFTDARYAGESKRHAQSNHLTTNKYSGGIDRSIDR